MTSDLRVAWTDLADAAAARSDVRSRPLGVTTPNGPVLAGLDAMDVRHVLVPVANRDDVHEDRRSRGVVVVAQPLVIDEEPQMFADVVCVDSRLFDVFLGFTESLLEALKGRSERHGEVPAMLLSQWRRLLAGGSGEALSDDVIVGLVGELDLLRRAHEVAGPDVLDAWHGPLGGEHDFTSRTVAVEVKATRSRESRRVRINGLGQLQAWDDVVLHVYFVRVRRDPNGTTLKQHVQKTLDLYPPRTLLDLLAHVGYSHGTDDADDDRWTVLESALYRVGDGFPRLVDDDLTAGVRPGVEDVSYICDLALAGDPLDDGHSRAVLGALKP